MRKTKILQGKKVLRFRLKVRQILFSRRGERFLRSILVNHPLDFRELLAARKAAAVSVFIPHRHAQRLKIRPKLKEVNFYQHIYGTNHVSLFIMKLLYKAQPLNFVMRCFA